MYVWFVSIDSSTGDPDQGIWQSTNGGASWTQISDSGIYCAKEGGCGVDQGFYNMELLAVPNGASATDLYAGAINLYKCWINSGNQTCSSTPFINLTHVYGCSPLGALAHVHPDQHALAYMIPSSGTDAGADLMYFANDGGIYRALNGFTGLTTGSCSGTNQFDDLNQNLGSMTQFVSFSQHPTDPTRFWGARKIMVLRPRLRPRRVRVGECSGRRWRLQRHRSQHRQLVYFEPGYRQGSLNIQNVHPASAAMTTSSTWSSAVATSGAMTDHFTFLTFSIRNRRPPCLWEPAGCGVGRDWAAHSPC